jgi:Uma2 family endonuclease
MAETDLHRDDMTDLIQSLKDHFALDPMTYVSGNLLIFYEEGNRHKHVSPDVFVVRGVKNEDRENYLPWVEGKAPDAVIEITSKSTMREDMQTKRRIYREVLRVAEYFQFDATEDCLRPSLQGLRLVRGRFVRIKPVARRLPSEVLGLHLELVGTELRLYDPTTRSRLLKRSERIDAAEAALRQLAEENQRLHKEIERLQRGG